MLTRHAVGARMPRRSGSVGFHPLAHLLAVLPAAIVWLTAGCARTEATIAESDYEIWAMDQGTHVIHVFDRISTRSDGSIWSAHGVRVPHMIEFTSDHRTRSWRRRPRETWRSSARRIARSSR
jgi:hypothetical protein